MIHRKVSRKFALRENRSAIQMASRIVVRQRVSRKFALRENHSAIQMASRIVVERKGRCGSYLL